VSYFISFGVDGRDEPVDGDHVASNTGWAQFIRWAGRLPEADYPELLYLAHYGEVFPEDAIAQLEKDVVRALGEKPGKPAPAVQSVARRLLAALRARPQGAGALVVTDGTAGDDEED
jgi:hypothetical protein